MATDALGELLASLRLTTRRSEVPPTLFLGSYPPRECGIATFTRDVVTALERTSGVRGDVIALEQPGMALDYGSEVVGRLCDRDPASYRAFARLVNEHPARLLNIQHEYGLFGGPDGEMLLEALAMVRKPIALTLHTVLPNPSEHHRQVTRELCRLASAVVVLSRTGKRILEDLYGLDPRKVSVIHHGVPDVPFAPTDAFKPALGYGGRLVVSTFGLISRGKGLEYAIDALPEIVERHPEVLYLIIGETHPVVRRQEGESYREMLAERIAALGMQDNVAFVNRYVTQEQLIAYLRATDVYLTPYLNPAQIVSGTLAYAMGLGKAIVSTPYLYAEELLANRRGSLAAFRDSGSIARKVNRLLDDPALRRCIERRAYRFGRQMTWPNVAHDYGRLFASLVEQTQPALAAAGSPASGLGRATAPVVPGRMVPVRVGERERRVFP
ncbi:MAG TPA: glycosyltransferase family 4 protein [Candidatus Dormibacteraeota bacterium]|nr:glycosyltransferase family 4 protein [Candidatus Dormibacteraeota bacterium]